MWRDPRDHRADQQGTSRARQAAPADRQRRPQRHHRRTALAGASVRSPVPPSMCSKTTHHRVPLIGVPGIVDPSSRCLDPRGAGSAGETIAEQVIKALAGDFVPFAVNVEAGAPAGTDHLPLCRTRRCSLVSQRVCQPRSTSNFRARSANRIRRWQALVPQGLLGNIGGDPVSYVTPLASPNSAASTSGDHHPAKVAAT